MKEKEGENYLEQIINVNTPDFRQNDFLGTKSGENYLGYLKCQISKRRGCIKEILAQFCK